MRPWAAAAAGLTVLIDRDHLIAERYGIVNVPTVVWIAEDGTMVRPNAAEFGDDQFVEFHGRPSAPHLEALRRWVVEGVVPDRAVARERAARIVPTADESQARVVRRLAAHLHRRGLAELAEHHFDRAAELAPLDFAVRRGSMPMRGQDPFGDPFFELFGEWRSGGSPSYDRR